MSWITLEQGKDRMGIDCTDPSRDKQVQSAIDYATALVEKWCERSFQEGQNTDTYFPPEYVVYLSNWPVVTIDDILYDDVSQTDLTYKLDKSRGVLYFDTGLTTFTGIDELKVAYTGGYNPVPQDLTDAVLDVAWARFQSADDDPSKGHVKFERVDGFVSTSYGDPLISAEQGILAPYAQILNRYRSERTQGSWM